MSHTVTVDIKFKNLDAFIEAAKTMGAQILGNGTHRLFGSVHTGTGIKLPGWSYPIVVNKEGEAFYDNYGGHWGNPADLATLKDTYAIAMVQDECAKLGWYTEMNTSTGELVVHHPSGGTIIVQKGGVLDACNFSGTGCAEATLKLEQAMGHRLGESMKQEMNDVQLNVGISPVE